ncbi:type I-C CRISPR-associated protein Cas5c [Paracoccus aeridis]|uniref:type I-C CRISPR-associated protein Cas5c n=1 Tax=Paracoccus aeridis TaxID=1966466 RepID=UPI0010AB1A0F|nr:type I-C CRISPR-associated protein Cas5c [Paracoccus aeridis]
MSYGVRLYVSAPYGLFTRPELKVERMTYDALTPSAARGILEAIHWKPAIRWVIDRIHVLAPIRTQTIRRNEVGHKAPYGTLKSAMKRGDLGGVQLLVDSDRQQRAATVLVRPAYVIEAHFELTPKAGPDDTDGKHLDIFNRRAARGRCFHQPCMGAREFPVDFRLILAGEALPTAIAEDGDLGLMLWDIDHAAAGRPSMFFRARMQGGIIDIPAPDSAEVLR